MHYCQVNNHLLFSVICSQKLIILSSAIYCTHTHTHIKTYIQGVQLWKNTLGKTKYLKPRNTRTKRVRISLFLHLKSFRLCIAISYFSPISCILFSEWQNLQPIQEKSRNIQRDVTIDLSCKSFLFCHSRNPHQLHSSETFTSSSKVHQDQSYQVPATRRNTSGGWKPATIY